jgi:DNA-binding GntR family transcriptional regulator
LPKPKYEVIAQFIREQIEAGRLNYGTRVPSGRELAEQFGTARATVVHAMDILRGEGLIVARQGSGFFVTDVPIGRPAGNRGSGTTRVTGAFAFRRLGDPVRELPPSNVAAQLGIEPGVMVLRRDRLMLLEDGPPASYVVAYFPPDVADVAPLLSRSAPLPGGTTRHIAATTGRTPARGVDITTARLATEQEAELLALERPAVVQVTLHTAYDGDGRPLVCEEGVTPAHLAERVDEYPMTFPA